VQLSMIHCSSLLEQQASWYIDPGENSPTV
jgi:hypothetical protein